MLAMGVLSPRAQSGRPGAHEKSPTVKGRALVKWWSWGDLNPRPQALFGQIYMFSGLI
jgi:hypothetical protein